MRVVDWCGGKGWGAEVRGWGLWCVKGGGCIRAVGLCILFLAYSGVRSRTEQVFVLTCCPPVGIGGGGGGGGGRRRWEEAVCEGRRGGPHQVWGLVAWLLLSHCDQPPFVSHALAVAATREFESVSIIWGKKIVIISQRERESPSGVPCLWRVLAVRGTGGW